MKWEHEPVLPWYRHRWPWLLMLGPFLVIVAAAITLWLAVRSDDGLVADDYYKQGLAINQATSRDRRAAALGLGAEMRFDPVRKMMRVVLRGAPAAAPEALVLKLSHPTRSGLDHTLRLRRDDGGGYSAAFGDEPAGRWYVSLEDGAGEWRLSAAWDAGKQPVLVLDAAAPAAAR